MDFTKLNKKIEMINIRKEELGLNILNDEYKIMLGFGKVDGVSDINKAINIIAKYADYSIEELKEDYYKPSCEIFFSAQRIAQKQLKTIIALKYQDLQIYSNELRKQIK
jgi:hypothetical protein